jgi:hypothetical protein
LDPFIAGLLGGYVVFGRSRSSISQQIVIYVFARVALGLAKLAVKPRVSGTGNGTVAAGKGGWDVFGDAKIRETVTLHAWPVFASLSWAMVMYLFKWHPDVVQPSMRSSMQYM